MRPVVACLFALCAALLPSCSLFSDGGVAEVWSTTDPISTSGISRQGVTAVDAERFYVVRDRTVRAYARGDGSERWRAAARVTCLYLTIVQDLIFCPSQGFLLAYDAESGRELWRYDTGGESADLIRPDADDERVFFGTRSRAIALDAQTGDLLWEREITGDGWDRPGLRSVTLSEGELLVGLEAIYNRSGSRSASVVVALDPDTGAERWRFQDSDDTAYKLVGSLTVWNGLVMYSNGSDDVVAFDRDTREVVWRYSVERGTLVTMRAPEVMDGVAYWAAGNSFIYAVDARTGTLQWEVEPEFGSYVNHAVCGPVVLANNSALSVVRRSDGRLLGIRFDNEVVGEMAVADGVAYVSTERGVYALDCASGA